MKYDKNRKFYDAQNFHFFLLFYIFQPLPTLLNPRWVVCHSPLLLRLSGDFRPLQDES